MVFFLCIPCLTLLLYFIILGLFFPKYRPYIKEGWTCFLDKLRGKKCSLSFDNKIHIAFTMWLAKRNLVGLSKFFHKKKNFDWALIIFMIIFTVVSTYLFVLLIKFLFFASPCADGVCAV